MSEEILRALIQLFAVISKQDGGVTEGERNYVINFFKEQLSQEDIAKYVAMYDNYSGYTGKRDSQTRITSVRDSLRALAVSKKINKTLTQKQKVIALIESTGLINSDQEVSDNEMIVLSTVASVFNISDDVLTLIRKFVTGEGENGFSKTNCLVAGHQLMERTDTLFMELSISGRLMFIREKQSDLYFVNYEGEEEITLNSLSMKRRKSYLFSVGSTIKLPRGQSIFYSDIIYRFTDTTDRSNISFIIKDLEYKFPSGDVGIRKLTLSERSGQLIGILGASGSGKTTLLRLLAGILQPSSGSIKVNGIDISMMDKSMEGTIGYVPQDDILFEELTVFQNLYYNAKLSLSGHTKDEINDKIQSGLSGLGLEHTRDLKVGNVLDQKISGGQRKRLNIALELVRQPAILFVDEPTSGLSSRDSENVIDLLKELTLLGKLIFVVIHQPSSDIYKMFDKLLIMDLGGYPAFYGHPLEAISYFKSISQQLDSTKVICERCGTVTPEQIFNILEAKVVDEFGNFSDKRKINPKQWYDYYLKNIDTPTVKEIRQAPKTSFKIPSAIKQFSIFLQRDVLSKVSDKQYLIVNLLEAPFLALILAYIIRYKNSPEGEYLFEYNDNIPAFLLMSIVVSLFLGLSISAEEIIKDRKLRQREQFLHLSNASYLFSKVAILFSISAFQIILFVLIGNTILDLKDMTFSFWLMLFSCATFANVLGLNISSAFKSAITVYIVIPVILIPQMILSGLLFKFDKLNDHISGDNYVPIVGDLMASRWALEGLAVYQFKNNRFELPLFNLERKLKNAGYKTAYWSKEMTTKINFAANNFFQKNKQSEVSDALLLIGNEIRKEPFKGPLTDIDIDSALQLNAVKPKLFLMLHKYINELETYYGKEYAISQRKMDKLIEILQSDERYDYNFTQFKHLYYNDNLANLVKNSNSKVRIMEYKHALVRKIDPVYFSLGKPEHPLNYRTHFFAPVKHLFGIEIDTYYFNVGVIWCMTIFLFLTLYFNLFKKILSFRRY